MSSKIVKAEKRKVKDGDTLGSLAKEAGITVTQLCKFNWGTADPHEVDKHMRTDVGSFKKSANGKHLIFSSDDDPGIVFLPKDVPVLSFAVNATHDITVEKLHKKTFIPSKVVIEFRPLAEWNGEYGFDWMRIEEDKALFPDEDAYKDAYADLVTSFIRFDKDGEVVEHTGRKKDFNKLKKEYNIIETQLPKQKEYFVPWLNLFSKTFADANTHTDSPRFTAELRMTVAIEDESPLDIAFDFNPNLFKLSLSTVSDKGVTARKLASQTLKITCLKDFDVDQEIKVLAFPKTFKLDDPIPLAGKIMVCRNSEPQTEKIVLVKVRTDVKDRGIDKDGEFKGTGFENEVENLRDCLFQGLIQGTFKRGPILDLSDDPNFKIIKKNGKKHYGKFIFHEKDPADTTHTDGGIFEDKKGIFDYVHKKFLNDPDNPDNATKFKKHFTMFSFGDVAYDFVEGTNPDGTPSGDGDGTVGQAQAIRVRNAFVFAFRDEPTMAHEALHGLGLQHAHLDGPPQADRKHTFTKGETDNIMSYNTGTFSLWHWQWAIMNKHV